MFSEIIKNGVVYMTSPNISCKHAFTTRFGGTSNGIYSSLNLGQSLEDDLNNVKTNYSKICNVLGISVDDIVKSRQVHGTNIRVVTEKDRAKLFDTEIPSADGMVTNSRNTALIIYTADCVPILLHDPVNKVIGAVHAGWRSTVENIAGKAIQTMTNEFDCSPNNIKAAIGPCISACCFETSGDVPDALRNSLGNPANNCIKSHNEKFLVDLKEANRQMLINAFVEDINISDECTSCNTDKYWSHRKLDKKRGSQASIIVLGD